MAHTLKDISVADFTAYMKHDGWEYDPSAFSILIFSKKNIHSLAIIPAHKCYDDFYHYLGSNIKMLADLKNKSTQEIIDSIAGAAARLNPLRDIGPMDAKEYFESMGWELDESNRNPNLMVFREINGAHTIAISVKKHFIDFYPLLEKAIDVESHRNGKTHGKIVGEIVETGKARRERTKP